MKATIGLTLSFVALLFGASNTVRGTESVVVETSRSLRVVVVDASKPGTVRSNVHETFAASFGASLGQGGVAFPVKLSDETDAAKAAAGLAEGVYDAALIFDNTLPAVFSNSNFAAGRGVSQMGAPVRVFHLVLLKEDAATVETLMSAFRETVKTARFQDALTRSAAIRVVASNTL